MASDDSFRPLGHVLLTGATGMVGGAVLRALLAADDVSRITSLGRRASGLSSPKLTEVEVADFGDRDRLAPHLTGVDTVIHCLATYSHQVSQEDYRKITVDWLEALLNATEKAAPEAQFALFSAAGARPDGGGGSFALRIKGEAETRLFAAPIPRKFAFRPGFIAPSVPRGRPSLGDRAAALFVGLIPASGVTANELAIAMLNTMRRDARAEAVISNRDLRLRIR